MADIVGDNSSETLPGTGDPDTIQGLGGSDVITGLGGTDTISGGDGGDNIDGGNGDDTIYGHSIADLDPDSGTIQATLLADVGFGAVFVTEAPGDDGFVYALTKDNGVITRIDTTTGATTAFLDIPDAEFMRNGEQGVLGLAFHPDYETNGRFFVYLTNEDGNCEIREYVREPGDPPTADPEYVQTIVTIPHPNTNHNGGSIVFGPDGYLYVSVGDGGGGNDLSNNAQNLDVLLGKILRIDIDSDDFAGDPTRNYAIPADNPFAGAVEGADEIWDYGLRNPWRISFDPVTGDLYIADVGQGAREEVNFEAAGGDGGVNYGWRLREGTIEGPGWPPSGPVDLTDPIYDYDHTIGRSITGGYVYHGPAPGLEGAYFFADFSTSRLFTLRVVDGVAEDAIDRTEQIVGADVGGISSFGTDGDGNLYAVTIAGEIFRLDPSAGAGDGADVIDGGSGDDEIHGGACDDQLSGGADDDTLSGGIGDDLLDGGAGSDSLDGGDGSDTASYADKAAPVVVTLNGASDADVSVGGIVEDTIRNIESLVGGSGDDTLTGDGLANRLDGGGGEDDMSGGAGNDTYVVDDAGDTVSESGGGSADTVVSSVAFTLDAGLENLTLTGSADIDGTGNGSANTLFGNAGDNTLDGKAEGDIMRGGLGNDTYLVNHAGDSVSESGGGGSTDTVESSVSFTLGAGLENLTLTGSGNIDATGNGADNILRGNSGANMLGGAGGADTMIGGAGNDTYVVNNGTDTVSESGGGGSADVVLSSVSFTLGTGLEYLTLTGSANVNATGNGAVNTLNGNSGSNRLDGAGGADTMLGGAGNDTYVVNNGGDAVSESGGGSADTVESSISYALGTGLEYLTLTGAANLNSTGNALGNILRGNAGANRLEGNAGNDTLRGYGGADVFVFDDGDGADRVNDFENGIDTCDLTAVAGVDAFSDLVLTDTGGGVNVDYGTGSFELANVANFASIDASDFAFA